MKKSILFLSFIFILIPVCLQAQFFIGGNISFNSSGGKQEAPNNNSDLTKTLGIAFNPMFGYYLNEDLAGGIRLGASMDKTTTPPVFTDGDETITISSTFGFMPFIRYHFVRFNKFSVFGQGQFGVTFGSQKTKVGDTETNKIKISTFGISLYPGLSFDVSDNFSLETQINAFGLGYSVSTRNNETTSDKTTTSNGYFGVNLDNIKTLGSISVGAIYRF